MLCKAFEEYVLGIFPETFAIERPDADGDIIPDFLVMDTDSRGRFAVVCVFQPMFHMPEDGACDILECGTSEQVRAYKQFAHFERLPLFLIVGVGGVCRIIRTGCFRFQWRRLGAVSCQRRRVWGMSVLLRGCLRFVMGVWCSRGILFCAGRVFLKNR